jgi:hypothetical protein
MKGFLTSEDIFHGLDGNCFSLHDMTDMPSDFSHWHEVWLPFSSFLKLSVLLAFSMVAVSLSIYLLNVANFISNSPGTVIIQLDNPIKKWNKHGERIFKLNWRWYLKHFKHFLS